MRAYQAVPGAARIESYPVQGLLPIDVQDEGDLRLYRMTLPFLPPSKNVYDNWPNEWKHAAKKKWIRHVGEWCEAMMVPTADAIGLAAVLVFPTKGRRDPQNYAQALWHWVPDALQAAGVIDDDREGKIQIGPNWGLSFAYDLRAGVPKERRQRTVIAMTMRVR